MRSPPTSFLGRDDALEQLAGWRSSDAEHDRLLTILGPGGVGKTRLALRHAETAGGTFVVCELGTTRNADEVHAALAGALGVDLSRARGTAVLDSIGEELARRRGLLVVLDECEHVVAPLATALERLLARAPNVRFLATSRTRLHVRGERCFDLAPLSREANEVASSEAARLFLDRARRVRADFAIAASDEDVFREVLARLDGLPLALELAAARMRVMGLSELRDRLDRRFDLLRDDARDPPRTLRAVLDTSWAMLPPWERAALRQCTVFSGGFDLAAFEAVVDLRACPGAPRPVDVIEGLCDHSLVVSRATPAGAVRFSLLDTIRAWAIEHVLDPSERAATEARHARHFLAVGTSWVEAADRGRSEAFTKISADQENLLAVHRRGVAEGAIDALVAARALDVLLTRRGPFEAHVALLDATLALKISATSSGAARRTTASSLRALLLVARARARRTHGDYRGARSDLDAALVLAKRARDGWAEARALTTLALLMSLEGDLEGARERFERARTLFARKKDARWEALSFANLGAIHQRAGRLEQARADYLRALEVLRAVEDERSIAGIASNLGLLLQELGQLDEARRHVEEALRIEDKVGDRHSTAVEHFYLGGIHFERGDRAAARESQVRAIDLSRALDDRPTLAMALAAFGATEATADCIDEAARALDEADVIAKEVGTSSLLALAELDRAHLDLARARSAALRGDGEEAARLRDDAHRRLRLTTQAASLTDEVRVARRMLEAALRPHAKGDAALVCADDFSWFQPPHGARIVLGGRGRVRAVLRLLVESRLENPGVMRTTAEVLRAVWPGERVLKRAGQNRVYVALAMLRQLGLRDAIRSGDRGYALDEAVPIVLAPVK